MAKDLINALQEVVGTKDIGVEAEATEENGIYHDIVNKTTEDDGVTARLGEGIYGSMKIMDIHSNIVIDMKDEIDGIADILPQIEAVGDEVGAVITVSNSIGDVVVASDNIAEINTVSINISDVVDVAGDSANINTVATNISDVSDVATINSEVIVVAGISADITAVNANTTNINTVAGNGTNITAVGESIDNVDAIADNMSDVEYFADRYHGPKLVLPTLRNDGTALQAGDLCFDIGGLGNILISTSGNQLVSLDENVLISNDLDDNNHTMRVYNGTEWDAAYANSYTTAQIDTFVGIEQTWQDVSGDRAVNTDYVNNTSSQITVNVFGTDVSGTVHTIVVDGVTVISSTSTGTYNDYSVSTVVPVGATYSKVGGDMDNWVELRA